MFIEVGIKNILKDMDKDIYDDITIIQKYLQDDCYIREEKWNIASLIMEINLYKGNEKYRLIRTYNEYSPTIYWSVYCVECQTLVSDIKIYNANHKRPPYLCFYSNDSHKLLTNKNWQFLGENSYCHLEKCSKHDNLFCKSYQK